MGSCTSRPSRGLPSLPPELRLIFFDVGSSTSRPSLLLSLPPELRLIIFDHVEEGDEVHLANYHVEPISQVCRQLREEYAAWQRTMLHKTWVVVDAHLLESTKGEEPLVFEKILVGQRYQAKELKARKGAMKNGLPIRKLELKLDRVTVVNHEVRWTVTFRIFVFDEGRYNIEHGLSTYDPEQYDSLDRNRIKTLLEPGCRRLKETVNDLVAVQKITAFELHHIEQMLAAVSRPGVPEPERFHPDVLWVPNAPDLYPPPPGGW